MGDMGCTMLDFLAQNYYLLNLLFCGVYVLVFMIYLGRFSPEDQRTGAFQRLLAATLTWAFFDLAVAWLLRVNGPAAAITGYRWLSCLFLAHTAAGGEMILSLMVVVRPWHRAVLYLPLLALYLLGLAMPQWVSLGIYGLDQPWPGPVGPWNVAFKTYVTIITLTLLGALLVDARSERDQAVRREKLVLFVGGVMTMGGIMTAQMLRQAMGPGFPWLANLFTLPTSLAVFYALKRYGRLLGHRALYETTVRLVPAGLAHVTDGVVTWCNKALAAMLGRRRQSLLGRPVAELAPAAAAEALARLRGGAMREEELDLAGEGDRQVPVLASSAPLDHRAPERGCLAVFTELSTVKRAEAERLGAERVRAAIETAGAACHEMNQPLQIITARAELLGIKRPGDAIVKHEAELIQAQAARMMEITRKLQTLTDYDTTGHPGGKRILKLDQPPKQ